VKITGNSNVEEDTVRLGNPTVSLIIASLEKGLETSPQIADATGISILTVAKSLMRLVDEGVVIRDGYVSNGKSGNSPTRWKLVEGMIILKKYSALICENGHLYCVVLKDIKNTDLMTCEDVEFSRDQGKVKNGNGVICNICQGKIKMPK
jgi:hypothetical protein